MIVKHIGEQENVGLYLPESFGWLILRSDIISVSGIEEILEHPEDYIESSRYFSWERYFTDLIESNTGNDPRKKYSKDWLANYYTSEYAAGKILDVLPASVKEFIAK